MAQSGPPPRQPLPHEESEAERRARAAAEEQATRAQAEAATAHLARPGMPARGPLTPSEAGKEGEPTVLMNFPTEITLTLPGYTTVYFPAGVQPVPVSLSTEVYLVDSGVTPVATGRT
jgi:hypothetical protein